MTLTNEVPRIRAILRAELPSLASRYAVTSLALFGSTARGEACPDSDLDILVSFRRAPGLIRFIELENHLTDLLGIQVDLVLADALKPNIRERVRAELVSI